MIDTVSRPKMFDGVGYKGKLGFVLIAPGLSEIPEVSAQKYIPTEIFRELTQIVLKVSTVVVMPRTRLPYKAVALESVNAIFPLMILGIFKIFQCRACWSRGLHRSTGCCDATNLLQSQR